MAKDHTFPPFLFWNPSLKVIHIICRYTLHCTGAKCATHKTQSIVKCIRYHTQKSIWKRHIYLLKTPLCSHLIRSLCIICIIQCIKLHVVTSQYNANQDVYYTLCKISYTWKHQEGAHPSTGKFTMCSHYTHTVHTLFMTNINVQSFLRLCTQGYIRKYIRNYYHYWGVYELNKFYH